MHRNSVTRTSRRLRGRRGVQFASISVAAALLTGSVLAVGAGADELTDKQARASQVASQLDALEEKVEALSEDAEIAKGQLMAAEQAVADAQGRADQANAEAARYSEQLQVFSVDAYVGGGGDPTLDAMFSANSSDASKVKGYLSAATSSRADLIDQFQSAQSNAELEMVGLSDAEAQLGALNEQLQSSLDQAQSAVDEQASIKSSLDADIASLVAAEQARKAAAAEAAAAARAAQAPAPSSPAAAAPTGTTPPINSTGGGPTPPSAPSAPAPSAPIPSVPAGAGGAVQAAMSRIGMPYVWAAAGPGSFDCSGLTMWAWAQAGRSLGHYTGSQYAQTRRIGEGDLQPGDLVFFWAPGAGGDPSHVGLYIGGGSMVHAPGRGRTVTTASIHYWSGARASPSAASETQLSAPSSLRALTRNDHPGASSVLVLLHGHGDAPEPLLEQAAHLVGPGTLLIAPMGPVVTADGGPAWFESAPGDHTPGGDRSLSETLDHLDLVLREHADRHPAIAANGLFGYSQGAATALAWALRGAGAPRWRPDVVATFAGWLPGEPDIEWDFPGAAATTRARLVHGRDDETVDPQLGRSAARVLDRAGVGTTFEEIAGDHVLSDHALACALTPSNL